MNHTVVITEDHYRELSHVHAWAEHLKAKFDELCRESLAFAEELEEALLAREAMIEEAASSARDNLAYGTLRLMEVSEDPVIKGLPDDHGVGISLGAVRQIAEDIEGLLYLVASLRADNNRLTKDSAYED